MKLLRNIAVLTGICVSTSLQAATEFDNGLVPIELVRDVNGGTYYKSLPDGFPVPEIPAALGLGVIGSVDRGIQQQVLLRNSAPGQTVRDALQAAYRAQGWITLQASSMHLTLCHDQHGTMQLRSNDAIAGEFRTSVTRTQYPAGYPVGFPGTATCAEQLEAIESGGSSGVFGFFQALMPVLEVPAGTLSPNPVPSIGIIGIIGSRFIRGFSGSVSGKHAEMTQDGTIELPDTTAAELHEHFALQLQDQGWVADSEAVGERSAPSVWYKIAAALPIPGPTEEQQEYTLVMTLLNTAQDTWRVTVKLQAGDSNVSGFVSYGVLGNGVVGVYPL